MNKRYVIVLALVVLSYMALSAAASEMGTLVKESREQAHASWSEEKQEGITQTSLNIDKTSEGTSISLEICRMGDEGFSFCEFGSSFTRESVFDTNNNLKSATLSPVDITLFGYGTTPKTVTVQADWEGVGNLEEATFLSKFESDGSDGRFIERTESMIASATGTVDRKDLGTSEFATLYKSESFRKSEAK